jgi:hypothetical protein
MKAKGSFVGNHLLLGLLALVLGLSWTILAPPVRAEYHILATELWVGRHPANAGYRWPVALAASSSGAYITGVSLVDHGGGDTNEDYLTIKYTPEGQAPPENFLGQEAWALTYNGTGNGMDFPGALALSLRGPGKEPKPQQLKPQSSGGFLYVTGASKGVSGTGSDLLTLKYSEHGSVAWTRRYNSPENNDEIAAALAVDSRGNVYVTGFTGDAFAGFDYLTVKYSPSGNRLWAVTYNGAAGLHDVALAVVVDPQGNVYVSGYSQSLSGLDITTIKYDPDGIFQWEQRYPGPALMSIVADVLNNFMIKKVVLALDAQGNVYVTGPSLGSGTGHDYATIKYSPDGTQLWATRYNNFPTNLDDIPTSMALDAQGNVYVTGYSMTSPLTSKWVTLKYDGMYGGAQRVEAYWDDAGGMSMAMALVLDAEGNIYVTGESNGDFLTIRYAATPSSPWPWDWSRRYECPAGDSRATAIVLDPEKPEETGVWQYPYPKKWRERPPNLYVAGYSKSESESGGYDMVVIKYGQYAANLTPMP